MPVGRSIRSEIVNKSTKAWPNLSNESSIPKIWVLGRLYKHMLILSFCKVVVLSQVILNTYSRIQDRNKLYILCVPFVNCHRKPFIRSSRQTVNSEINLFIHVVDVRPDWFEGVAFILVCFHHCFHYIWVIVIPWALVESKGPKWWKNWLSNYWKVLRNHSICCSSLEEE